MKLAIDIAPVFEPLLQPMDYKGAFGGRGSTKSWFFASLTVATCVSLLGARILCVREVQKSLAQSVKKLIEDRARALEIGSLFDPRKTEITTPGNGVISFVGMQDHTAESIMSYEGYDRCWIEQGETLARRSFELLRPTIRKVGSEIWASWNPRSPFDIVDEFFRGPNPPQNALCVRSTYKDNPWFSGKLEADRQHDEKHRPDRYGHVWLGDYEPTAIDAIWSRQMFFHGRQKDAPEDRGRTVVAVDPAGKSGKTSNKTGIVVSCVAADGRGYVLEDATMKGTPHQWASRAVSMYDKWDADCIVGEVNNGGEMVEHTIRTVRPSVPFKAVTATRGKHVRAEPIASLYERDRISHCGTFPELEDQFCRFTPSGYDALDEHDSPDNADAAIWGLTELFPPLTRSTAKPVTVQVPIHDGGWMA